jgi:cytochrome bd ubiquinol oxidase subunit I
MDELLASRILMGGSLAFHIVYAALGIGLPLMLLIAEGLALWKKDDTWHLLARRWARTAAVLFAIGAVSGTALSFELGFLWPRFMAFGGPLIGLPFSLEAVAFFLEAIFLGLYLYGARRLSRGLLFLTTIPIVLASAASAVFVISVNSFMATPAGFTLEGGALSQIDPWRAMANPAWAQEAIHGTLASYVAAGFAVAGVHAFALLRRGPSRHHARALALSLGVAAVFLPTMFVSGHRSAQILADQQPRKLAAMEALFETQPRAPLVLGGWPDAERRVVRYGLEVPGGLSLLAYNDPDAVVRGLEEFPRDEWPDSRVVHLSFDAMVGTWSLMVAVALVFWVARWRGRGRALEDRPPWLGRKLLLAIVASSPLGFLALESGWFVTEFGRQPFLVDGLMRLEEGVTPNPGIWMVLVLFTLLYAFLTTVLVWLLLQGGRDPEPIPERAGGAAR